MADLADYIYDSARGALDGIPDAERSDIYVVSFFVYDEEDDPRRPTVTVGYNSEADVARSSDPAEAFSTDEHEARWNYAFWRQKQLTVIPGVVIACASVLQCTPKSSRLVL